MTGNEMASTRSEELRAKRSRRAARIKAHKTRYHHKTSTVNEGVRGETALSPFLAGDSMVESRSQASGEETSVLGEIISSVPSGNSEDVSLDSSHFQQVQSALSLPTDVDKALMRKTEIRSAITNNEKPSVFSAEVVNGPSRQTRSYNENEASSSGYQYAWSEAKPSRTELLNVIKPKKGDDNSSVETPPGSSSSLSRLSRRSLASARSRRRARRAHNTRKLEEMVSITVLQTAADGVDSAHFVVQEQQKAAEKESQSTDTILSELLSLSVDGEPSPSRPVAPVVPAKPADDTYSLYSLPVEDADGWIRSRPGQTSKSGMSLPTESIPFDEASADLNDTDSEMDAMRSTALMDDESSDLSSILGHIMPVESNQDSVVEEEGIEVVHRGFGVETSSVLSYSSSTSSGSESEEDADPIELIQLAGSVSHQPLSISGGSGEGTRQWYKHPGQIYSDVFDGLDDVEPSRTETYGSNLDSSSDSEDSEDDMRSAADRSGAFPTMLETPIEVPGMESEETDSEEEDEPKLFDDPADVEIEEESDMEYDEPALSRTETDIRHEHIVSKPDMGDEKTDLCCEAAKSVSFKASEKVSAATELDKAISDIRVEKEKDEDWTMFDASPFGGFPTRTATQAVHGSDPGGATARATDVSQQSDGSGNTAPLPIGEEPFPDSPTSVSEFSARREQKITKPETHAIGTDEWNSQ